MRYSAALAGLSAIVAVSACAHPNGIAAGPPNFTPVMTTAAPKARLYADCIAQAAANGTYGRAHDAETELVLFTCTGVPAKAFYDGLGVHSAAVGSERQLDGRILRSTNPVQRDMFGVDWCSTDGRDHTCVVSLNAGNFLWP